MRTVEFKNRLSLKRISNRLIFFVSIGIITSTIALYLFLSSTQQKLIFDSFYTSTNGTLDAAKLGIELSHSEEKYDMMLQVFNWIKARDHFRFIYLTEEVDGDEEVLIAFPEKESKTLSLLTKLYTNKSIRDSIYVLKTAWKSKNGNGHLYVGFSTSKIRAYEKQIVYDLTLFTILSVILAVIIVFFVTASVTKPLSDLKNVTDKIRDGKIHERANEIVGGIEVSSVSKAFNKMVDELSRTQKELSNEIYEAAIFVQSILPDQIYSDLRVEWRFL
ncbi:MAG: hypothetical protein C0412_19790, partial [Flavobacterium sp.]|nr:hypothetical protein [Flavobacterium sp.]